MKSSKVVRDGTSAASPRRGLHQKLLMTVLSAGLLASALCLGGCSHVAPYERGTLAHPTMSADDMASGIDEHVRAVSEGATGGFGGGGGGCGCN